MDKLTPLLSESFADLLIKLRDKHNSQIAEELLYAHTTINALNKCISYSSIFTDEEITNICSNGVSKINNYITDEVRAMSVRRDVFEIAFTPKGKELKYNAPNTWSREGRQTGKPGRIIKKLMVTKYNEREIEIFSNLLKSELVTLGEFKIVSGEDIRYWYDQDNYYRLAGTLGNSCMKYDECQSYFNVYVDHAKMLICVKDDKLLGRALIWELDDKTFMDRVYVCEDYLEEQFYQYAHDNTWYVRESNTLLHDGENQVWKSPSGDYFYNTLEIQLNKEYNYFPYMDSFRYFDPQKLTLCTTYDSNLVALSNTDGDWETYSTYQCECCGHIERVDPDELPDMHYSEYHEAYYCDDCCVYNEYLDDYISNNVSCVTVFDGIKYYDVPLRFVSDNACEVTEKLSNPFGDYFFDIDSKYYTIDALHWDEEEKTYKVNE